MTEAKQAERNEHQAVAPAGTEAFTFTLARTATARIVPEPWVNAAAACGYLDISRSTLMRWVRRGKLTPHRTPTGEMRFRLSSLDAVLHIA